MFDTIYALTWDFIDTDGRPRQMLFRRSLRSASGIRGFNQTGQLIAVVDDVSRHDYGDEIALSRPDVFQTDIDEALDGWQEWAMLFAPNSIERYISLLQIRRRLRAQGLDQPTAIP